MSRILTGLRLRLVIKMLKVSALSGAGSTIAAS